MSLLSSIEGWIQKDEQWIANFLVQAKADWLIFEAEASSFWSWISAHTVEISNDANTAASIVNKIAAIDPAAVPAQLLAIVNTANSAVATLTTAVNAANTAKAAGGSVVDAAIAAYTASKTAQSAVGQALSAVIAAAPARSTPVQQAA